MPKSKKCVWEMVGKKFDDEWITGCGTEGIEIIALDTVQRFKFCPFCGRKIEMK